MGQVGITKLVYPIAGRAGAWQPASFEIPKPMAPLFGKNEEFHAEVITLFERSVRAMMRTGVQQVCIVEGKDFQERDESVQRCILRMGMTPTVVQQEKPLGLGHAIKCASSFTGKDPFFVQLNDVAPMDLELYEQMCTARSKFNADHVLLLREVDTPSKYGIAEVDQNSTPLELGGRTVYRVIGAAEHPEKPKSKLAICGLYLFNPSIMDSLHSVRNNRDTEEIELTDAIDEVIKEGDKVVGIFIDRNRWLNVGVPDKYFIAQTRTASETFPPDRVASLILSGSTPEVRRELKKQLRTEG